MSEENRTVTISPNGLSDYQVQDLVNSIKDNDMQVLAQLLVDLKKENDKANKVAKRQSIFAMVTSGLCLILVIVLIVVCSKFLPIVEQVANDATKLIADTNEVVLQANDIIKEADGIIDEVNGVISEVDGAIVDVLGMIDQTNGMLDSTSAMIDDTAVIIKNLEDITNDLTQVDYTGIVSDVNSLVKTSEESLEATVKKIDDVDLDSLNKAIKDLSSIISPLARLFRK